MTVNFFKSFGARLSGDTFRKPQYVQLAIALLLSTLAATSSLAQSPDDTWRQIYPHLQCAALAETGLQEDAATAHLKFALQLLDENTAVFSERLSGFKNNGSEADSFGRPVEVSGDPHLTLGRYFQIIASQIRHSIDGPPVVYPEGMTVSPSMGNEVVRVGRFINAYKQQGCSTLCEIEGINCGEIVEACVLYESASFCPYPSRLPH
jgi:hypothetical protein